MDARLLCGEHHAGDKLQIAVPCVALLLVICRPDGRRRYAMQLVTTNMIDCETIIVRTTTGPGGLSGPLRVDFHGNPIRQYTEREARFAFERMQRHHAVAGWGAPADGAGAGHVSRRVGSGVGESSAAGPPVGRHGDVAGTATFRSPGAWAPWPSSQRSELRATPPAEVGSTRGSIGADGAAGEPASQGNHAPGVASASRSDDSAAADAATAVGCPQIG